MPQSLSSVYLHLVFATKDRLPLLLDPGLRGEAHAYLGGISKQLDRKMSFMDEYRGLLRKHGVEWDERYVWD